MPDRYYVQLQDGSFVGPSSVREIQEAYGAHKLRWNDNVFAAEGGPPEPGSAPWGTVASLADPYSPQPHQAVDLYTSLLSVTGWIIIIIAAFDGAVGLLRAEPGSMAVLLLSAAGLAAMGLGVVAAGQLLRCIRAMQADVRAIAAELAHKRAAA